MNGRKQLPAAARSDKNNSAGFVSGLPRRSEAKAGVVQW
jgi:hypothetical protein